MKHVLARVRRGSPLAIVFASVFIDMLGYGMIVPLLPFLVREYSASALLVGLLSSLYALMQLFMAPLLGAVSDRIGRRPVLIGCLAGSGVAYLLLGLSNTLGLLFLAVGLGGMAGASLPTAQAYIADTTKPEDRARGLGLIGAAFGLGLMIGPALGGLLSSYGLAVPALAAAAFAALNTLYALIVLPESLPPERRSHQPLHLRNLTAQLAEALTLRRIRLLLVAIFLLNLAFAGLQSNFPLFSTVRFGWDVLQNGIFFAFVGGCAVVTQGFLIGKLQPLWGEAPLVLAGLGLMTIGLLLIALAPQAWLLYPLVGIMAVGLGLAIPSLSALVSQRAGEHRQGAVMGGTQALLSLTLIIGPLLAGLAFDLAGPGAPYLLGSGLASLAFLTAAVTLRPLRSPSEQVASKG
ncbi:MFS transporter [Candidatus Chloroploca asiatica]|uniref:MFS transporter n=1 Tax=Candidatus Chloroploca asiatica TaxID=1506545 RepID=A0A2H3KG58_9CHLR|nr:MFS transporter [Candidatus Chloroploca asiatica]PDV96715.1 MFS transporter [Candidatus Chloroploca asiatica]